MPAKQKYFPLQPGETEPRKVYAKIRVLDNEILSRSAHWPAFPDDTLIVGDDGATKYLPYLEDSDPVEYDSDLFSVVTSELVGSTTFILKKDLVKRPPSELKTRAKNYESLYRSELIPPQELSALSVIGLAIVFKTAKNLSTSPVEDSYIADIINAANKLTANAARLSEITSQLDEGQSPDLKDGWLRKE